MSEKRLLSVQDISCVGQCSLTVALPVISACGIETSILPAAVLSTHTGGFQGFTFRDLTDDIPAIVSHWEREGIAFDAVYTGYLGSRRQIALVGDLFDRVVRKDGLRIVDPAMADHGKLYAGFDAAFAATMAELCGKADLVLPNMTEAAMMTGIPYVQEGYDEAYIRSLMDGMLALGAKTVVLTGVSYTKEKIGVAVLARGEEQISYYFHDRLPRNSHGTGDVFASSFTGALVGGRAPLEAAQIAADFTVAAMRATEEAHWYGVRFEKVLPLLAKALEE